MLALPVCLDPPSLPCRRHLQGRNEQEVQVGKATKLLVEYARQEIEGRVLVGSLHAVRRGVRAGTGTQRTVGLLTTKLLAKPRMSGESLALK